VSRNWRVVGLIPARGGSKGVPRKNIRLLGGRPLLEYTARSALAARRLSRVVLSTEDPEVAEVGTRCGLDVPFMRPPDLAHDATPSLPVVQHALQWLEGHGDRFDAADAVVTVRRVPDDFNPHWTYGRDEDGYLHLSTGEPTPVTRRQDLPPVYHRDGSVYVTQRDVVIDRNSLYGDRLVGYVVADERPWLNIDTPEDWARAEELIVARAN